MNNPKIEGITLPSAEEINKLSQTNPRLLNSCAWFWLRTPYTPNSCFTSLVEEEGFVSYYLVNYKYCVRPILKINLEESVFKIGDSFKINDYEFTIIDSNIALMNDLIRDESGDRLKIPFNKNYKKGNNYEDSDIKKFLDNFLYDKLLTLDELLDQGYTFKEINNMISSKEQLEEVYEENK